MNRLHASLSAISLAFLALGCSSSSESEEGEATETGGGGQALGTGGGVETGAGGSATGGIGTASTTGGSTGTGANTSATGGLTSTTGGATSQTGSTGGATGTMATGGTTGSATGGRTGGGPSANTGGITGSGTGGVEALTGGNGGTPGATGGAPGATGGTPAETGGTPAETGGTPAETGGTPTATGGEGTDNPNCDTTLPVLDDRAAAEDYTETAAGISLEMVYVPGGAFTLGCEGGGCDPDTSPVEGVTVSSYHISKTEITTAMMQAVMGEAPGFGTGTWYDCIRFACELSRLSGRAYHMQTEAEFEYAAKNHLSQLEQIDGSEEWAYNSWSTSHSTVLNDPVGPSPGEHTQKTRRDKATGDNITGRLIRSIDGIGPACRLVVSNEMDYPPEYVPPCQTCQPKLDGEPENSYRDPRWITGDDTHWATGSIAIGNFELQVWEDGTAKMGTTEGQWFTSNNIAFAFVPSSGTLSKYAYIFLDKDQGSVISDKGFMNGGYIGRYERAEGGGAKPTIANLKSGAELAAEAGDDYEMVDMVNIPVSAQEQDPRLLDGAGNCWFQNNSQVGGTHNYRKDVDPDEFRFAVIDGGQKVMLANGSWFTVNNTFLRITHPDGYVAEYLYAVSDGTFYHNSFMGYERADFRMFEIYESTDSGFPATCVNNSCSGELAKGAAQPIYATLEDGESTFTPAPCPAGGCG